MTLTILALALVVLMALLSLACVMHLAWTTTRNQTSMGLRMAQAAETAIAQSGETAALAFQEANQAGMLAMTKAIALVEASDTRAQESIEQISARAQESVDQAALRSQEVVADSQRTIRLISSQLFPTASPAPPTDSPIPPGDPATQPWDEIQFGTEEREQAENQWPPAPRPPGMVQAPPGAFRDGEWIVAPDSQQPGWEAAPAGPPPEMEADDVTLARFHYEQARQVDPNPE